MPLPANSLTAGLLLAMSVALAACVTVNTDFTPPSRTSLNLGRSTEQDVMAAEGPPQVQTVTTWANRHLDRPLFRWAAAPGTHYDILRYSYGQAVPGGLSLSRQASFFLANGRLAGWTFLSDDPMETTNFDVTAAQQVLGTGKPTLAEIIAAVGPPTSHFVYPLTSAPDLRMESWEYVGAERQSGNRVTKTLSVLVGSDDRTVTYYLHQEDAPLPVTRTVIVPIIVR